MLSEAEEDKLNRNLYWQPCAWVEKEQGWGHFSYHSGPFYNEVTPFALAELFLLKSLL